MKIQEGDKIPNSDFFYIDENGVVKKIKSTELLDKQKAIVIGVPGAFTKVCSAKHLPGYVNNFDEAKKKGITIILCVSVNDPNVMKAWGEHQNVEDKILMNPIKRFRSTLCSLRIFVISESKSSLILPL